MRRYLALFFSLVALSVTYAALGGFGPLQAPSLGRVAEPLAASPEIGETVANSEALAHDGTHGHLAAVETQTELAPEADELWTEVTIGRNESFYQAFQRAGYDHETIMGLVNACKPHADLRRVQRGDVFRVSLDESGVLSQLRFDLDAEHFLRAQRGDDGSLVAELRSYPVTRIVKGVQGSIDSNLFDALREAQADPSLAGKLADILGWDIDFFRDIRKGDTFTVVYEEYHHEGRRVRDGRILAASFANRGRTHQAFAYENALGFPAYYDEEGRSLEKQFLRAPLRFHRISSNFSRRRLHPVLKSYRPHYGTDYAANVGTPIHATASGVITVRERHRGNGNYVVLRHGSSYETWYLHMSRFKGGLSVGSKVQQGDVIGFVGSTGFATGPHVCYRIRKNNSWVDPRKLDVPPAAPIEDHRREEYEIHRAQLAQLLDDVPVHSAVILEEEGPQLRAATPAVSSSR